MIVLANPKMGITIKGVTESLNFLEKMNKLKQEKLNDAVHQAGFFVESEVKESIAGRRAESRSVDTGHFLQSVATDNSKDYESNVYTDVDYGPFLEYGTTRIKERRHFRNSLERNRKKVVDFVNKKVNY